MAKVRADLLLTERGLAPSRTRAQALILAGRVFSGEARVNKAGDRLAPDAPLEVRGDALPYVSRGGLKLEGALDAFGYDPAGKVCADFGASTGGFTDCLLQRHAAKVYAIDVGYGQLATKLRNDERVVVMERTNARHLKVLPEAIELVVIDASFIGLGKLLPAATRVLDDAGEVIAMVKPQFEVGRENVGKGGVVRDPVVRAQAIDAVAAAAQDLGLRERARADAAIRGPKGNHEAFLWLVKDASKPDQGSR
ncbi:MAG: TlyA family RNA methyltransferase [Myxococcota bacterium]